MRGRVGLHVNGGGEFVVVMVLVIAAEDVAVPFLPVLKSVAGGAEADDGFSGGGELAKMRKLFIGQGHAADVEDREVGRIESFQTSDGLRLRVGGAGEVDALRAELGFELFLQRWQRVGGLVFELAAHERDGRRLGWRGICAGADEAKQECSSERAEMHFEHGQGIGTTRWGVEPQADHSAPDKMPARR